MRRYAYPRGALSPVEAAILTELLVEPTHTLQLRHALRRHMPRAPAHQTLYVLMQRLRDAGYVRTAYSPPGQPREHTVTVRGRRALASTMAFWIALRASLVYPRTAP